MLPFIYHTLIQSDVMEKSGSNTMKLIIAKIEDRV